MAKSHYFEQVYDITRCIPVGRVTTYGAIADYLALGSARMVGWALNKCDLTGNGDIPAQRVVNRLGELSGRAHFQPPGLMQALLESEGIEIKDHKVQNFAKHLWHPSEMD